MRNQDDAQTPDVARALYAGDIPQGVRIECSRCGAEVDDLSKPGEQLHCPTCRKELVYPSGAEW